MYSPLYLIGILLIGFVTYFFFRDYFFDSFDGNVSESFYPVKNSQPAHTSITVRQAPSYPERNITPSGPSAPSQEAGNDVTVYGPPQATDPYQEMQESSLIPETLRHPERAYRPAPSQHHTSIAVEAGLASQSTNISSDASVSMNPEMIHNGGEFMSGVFANDTLQDTQFSLF